MDLIVMKIGGTTSRALLGLLSIGSMSGYDIRQLIPWSIGHFWSESYGQIYPALKQLNTEGLVQKKTERQKGRPDRNVYSLTIAGREALQQWLAVPVEASPERNELLLKLFFGAHAANGISQEHVRAYEARHQAALTIFTATADRLKQEQPQDPQLPFWLMTLNFGRHRSLAAIAWCKETLQELEQMEKEKHKL